LSAVTGRHGENPYAQQIPQNPTVVTAQSQARWSPAPYGQHYGAPPREHPHGTLILIFGIIGIFVTIFAPIAWNLGSKARKEIRASGIPYSNESNVNAGRILGMILSIVWLVVVGIMILTFAVPTFLFFLAPVSSAG
jgi:hypothetical protein